MNDRHIELIHQLFSAADQINLPLWLQGGWAIDAKLNCITREHEDIDIAYPGDRTTEFLALLHSLDGDPKIFRVLRSPKNHLVKLQHKTYMSSSKTFLLHPLTLTEREVFTTDAFTD